MRLSSIVLAGGALLAVKATIAAAQIPAVPPGRTYAFEVASVKASDPEERLRVFDFKPTGSLTARNLTLHRLIAAAYGTPFPIPLPDERIVGGPEWLTTARFAVEARALVRMGGAPRKGVTLRPSESECGKNPAGCGLGGGPGRMQLRGAPLDLVVFALAEEVGRPVVNQTGLEGLYDGTLEWAATPEETGASIFTAIEEQFGLKLRDARAIETLVITHAELPSEN